MNPLVEVNKKMIKNEGENNQDLNEMKEEINDDENEMLIDNEKYCHEIVQNFFPDKYKTQKPEESQEILIGISFYTLSTEFKDFLEKETEIQYIIEEWNTVHQMHEDKKLIKDKFRTKIQIEQYNKKDFYIILNFDDINNTLINIISKADENICNFSLKDANAARKIVGKKQMNKMFICFFCISSATLFQFVFHQFFHYQVLLTTV